MKIGDMVNNILWSLLCLEKVLEILGKFVERWEVVGVLREGFEVIG